MPCNVLLMCPRAEVPDCNLSLVPIKMMYAPSSPSIFTVKEMCISPSYIWAKFTFMGEETPVYSQQYEVI